MKYRKLSSAGDFVFGNSALDFYINTPDAVAQAVETRLLLWLGEWFLDIEEGTAWIEGVLGKHSLATVNGTIRTRILTTEGMVSIDNYTSTIDPDTRRLSVSVTLNTIYGVTTLEVNNYANF